MKVKSKLENTNCIYNPALDKFQNTDVFPEKTKAAQEHLKGRNIRLEIQEILKKGNEPKP